LGCLARTLGPAVSGALYRWGLQIEFIGLPFWSLSAIMGVGLGVSFLLRDYPWLEWQSLTAHDNLVINHLKWRTRPSANLVMPLKNYPQQICRFLLTPFSQHKATSLYTPLIPSQSPITQACFPAAQQNSMSGSSFNRTIILLTFGVFIPSVSHQARAGQEKRH
jgi:hypothetical protein